MHHILNDEPAVEDGLERQVLARMFAELAGGCQTPFVIGVYASWGMGKTSFMRLIESELGELGEQKMRAVWFNAWQHDQDVAPSLSLLHAMVDALDLRQEFKHALSQVAAAFGSVLMQKTTSLTFDNLQKIQKLMDEESFRVRDARSNLRDYFVAILAKARREGIERIVFFVDDLDRCSTDTVLKTLEAIKLYFNLEGCVFFLGIDRECVETAIAQSDVAGGKQSQYLDKLIQLPFSLPALSEATFKKYLEDRLPTDLAPCLPLIQLGLDRNPRSAKRFINDLQLRHQFASALSIRSYDPRLLALLLLFEYLDPALFAKLTFRPALLLELFGDRQRAETEITSPRLLEALYSNYVPKYTSIESYVSLTNLSVVEDDVDVPPVDVTALIAAHREWLRTNGKRGGRAVFSSAMLEEKDFAGHILRDADFESAILSRSIFTGADLRRAIFAGASMLGARFDGSCLRFADLREADLRNATLQNADLRSADLRRTNFRGADLRNVIGLTEEQIGASLTDAKTQLPAPLCRPYHPSLSRSATASSNDK